jgi:hypothetical protein
MAMGVSKSKEFLLYAKQASSSSVSIKRLDGLRLPSRIQAAVGAIGDGLMDDEDRRTSRRRLAPNNNTGFSFLGDENEQ